VIVRGSIACLAAAKRGASIFNLPDRGVL